MTHVIPLRPDYDGDALRVLARSTEDANQARRLLALSLIYDGGSRTEAAQHADVSVQTVRDWILRFNTAGPSGLVNGKSTGTPPRLNATQRAARAEMVEVGPIPYRDGVVRWRLSDLVAWVHDELDVTLDETTVGRALRAKMPQTPAKSFRNKLGLNFRYL